MSEEKTLTPDKAKELLAREQQKRINACNKELQEVLTKYNCTLDVSMIIKPGNITPMVNVIAQDEK